MWGCQGEIFKVKTSWIIGLWMLFIGGALLSGILEMQYLGGSEDVSGVFNRMMSVPSLSNLNILLLHCYYVFTYMMILRSLFNTHSQT